MKQCISCGFEEELVCCKKCHGRLLSEIAQRIFEGSSFDMVSKEFRDMRWKIDELVNCVNKIIDKKEEKIKTISQAREAF